MATNETVHLVTEENTIYRCPKCGGEEMKIESDKEKMERMGFINFRFITYCPTCKLSWRQFKEQINERNV